VPRKCTYDTGTWGYDFIAALLDQDSVEGVYIDSKIYNEKNNTSFGIEYIQELYIHDKVPH